MSGLGNCTESSVEAGPWWVPYAFTTPPTPPATPPDTPPADPPQNPPPPAATLQRGILSACTSQRPLYSLEGPGDWIKMNAGQHGFYRVNYAPALWERLIAAAKPAANPIPPPGTVSMTVTGALGISITNKVEVCGRNLPPASLQVRMGCPVIVS